MLMVEACAPSLRIGSQIPIKSLGHSRMPPIALDTQELAQNVLHEVFGERVQRFVVSFIHLVHPEIEHQSAQRATWRSIVVDMMLIFAARDASGNVAELHDLANGHVGSDKIL